MSFSIKNLRSQARILIDKKTIRTKIDPRSIKGFEKDIEFVQRPKLEKILNFLLEISNEDSIGVVSKPKITKKCIRPLKVVVPKVPKSTIDTLYVHGNALVLVHHGGSFEKTKQFQL